MVSYNEIVAELTSEWNIEVIALPSFAEGHIQRTSKYPNKLFIATESETFKPKTSNNRAYYAKQFFYVYPVALSLSDLEKYRSEIARIILAMTIVGGHIIIINLSDPEHVLKRYNQKITFQQIKHKKYTAI